MKFEIVKYRIKAGCHKIRHYYLYATSKSYRNFCKNPMKGIILFGIGLMAGMLIAQEMKKKEETTKIQENEK